MTDATTELENLLDLDTKFVGDDGTELVVVFTRAGNVHETIVRENAHLVLAFLKVFDAYDDVDSMRFFTASAGESAIDEYRCEKEWAEEAIEAREEIDAGLIDLSADVAENRLRTHTLARVMNSRRGPVSAKQFFEKRGLA